MLATKAAGPSSNPVKQGSPSTDAKRCAEAELASSRSLQTPAIIHSRLNSSMVAECSYINYVLCTAGLAFLRFLWSVSQVTEDS